MKYPKPGYHNPLVSVHVFDLGRYLERVADLGGEEVPAEEETLTLDWDGRRPVEDSVVLEVAWVGNGSLVLKEVNRNADDGNVLVFDLDDVDSFVRSRGRVVRRLGREGEEGDSGWIDNVCYFLFSLLLCAMMLMVVVRNKRYTPSLPLRGRPLWT